MNIATWISIILLIVAAFAMIGLVLMQDTKSSGLGTEFGGNTDSFFGKNRSKTKESRLAFLTQVAAIAIAVFCVVATLLLKYYIS